MALTLNGVSIPASGSVTFCGSQLNKVVLNGTTVWQKSVGGWQTLWSGTQSFTETGYLAVSGLGTDGEVRISATVEFNMTRYDAMGGKLYESNSTKELTAAALPNTVQGIYATAELIRYADCVMFTFKPYRSEFKGDVTYETPTKITITKVEKKL